MSKIFIIIPAYNEAKVIQKVIADLRQKLSDKFKIVVVNDGSSDQTQKKARSAGAQVLHHVINCGYGAATKTGIKFALSQNAEIIVTFDADGQHNPQDIERLIKPILDNKSDVVLGSRFKEQEPGWFFPASLQGKTNQVPTWRRLFLKIAVLYTRLISGLKITDAHNGLRAISAQSAQIMNVRENGMNFASGFLQEIARHKLRLVEIPVSIKYTDYSRGKGEGNLQKIMLGVKFLVRRIVS